MKILVMNLLKKTKIKLKGIFKRSIHNFLDLNVKHRKTDIFWFLLLMLFVVSITSIVYQTGGTNSYVHLLYIPMISSIFLLSTKIAILVAFVAGLLVRPYMPYNVEQHIMQQPFSWILRLVMFVLVVSTVGFLVDYIKKQHNLEQIKANEDIFTGYPNFNKWKNDITIMNQKK